MINLKVNDYTGISFWIISIALGAVTAFLILEKQSVKEKWKLPLTISSLVTGIAAFHYLYMRKIWVINKQNPIVFRYIDWILTVPLQIIEFYLILSVSKKIPQLLFYKLLGASIIMLVFGFLGESLQINRTLGFTVGMIAWLYILYEIFFGQAAKLKNESKDPSVIFAFDALKWIITLGWSIYPIGYLLNNTKLNLMYNLGDFINKILFGLIIWYAAKKEM